MLSLILGLYTPVLNPLLFVEGSYGVAWKIVCLCAQLIDKKGDDISSFFIDRQKTIGRQPKLTI